MQCNIDRSGRTLRLVMGAIIEMIGFALLLWWYRGGPPWSIWPAIACIGLGNFAIIEGTIGWCAVRAMGFRTPI